ncbi:MAG: hypothetical protein V1850_04005 [Candidatus Bathyarchaeota archaeon]
MSSVKRRKRTKTVYTQGEVNRLIDNLIHPWIKNDETRAAALVVDSLLHGLVEQNLLKSLEKFSKYTLPKLLEIAFKELEKQNKK